MNLQTIDVPNIPVWGVIIILIISIAAVGALIYLSIFIFKYYNLNNRVKKANGFEMKYDWFGEAFRIMAFAFPIVLIVPIVVMNVIFMIGNL